MEKKEKDTSVANGRYEISVSDLSIDWKESPNRVKFALAGMA